MRKLLNVLIVLLLLSGCKKDVTNDIFGLKSFVQDEKNGLIQKYESDLMVYKATFLPSSYQAAKDIGFDMSDKAKFLTAYNDIEGHYYFHLKLKTNSPSQLFKNIIEKQNKDWNAVQNQLLFHFQKQFKLYAGDQELACKLYQPFQGLNSKNELEFMLVFKSKHENSEEFQSDLELNIVEDVFTNQTIRFTFPKVDLNRIPKLHSLTKTST